MAYVTPGTVAAGDVATAAAWNVVVNDLISHEIPAACEVYRTSTLTPYTSGSAIVWQAERFDTNNMWTSGSAITVQTAGNYLITFTGRAGATGTSRELAGISINGTSVSTIGASAAEIPGAFFAHSTVHTCSVGDLITAKIDFVGGSSYTITGGATLDNSQTRLRASRIGATS